MDERNGRCEEHKARGGPRRDRLIEQRQGRVAGGLRDVLKRNGATRIHHRPQDLGPLQTAFRRIVVFANCKQDSAGGARKDAANLVDRIHDLGVSAGDRRDRLSRGSAYPNITKGGGPTSRLDTPSHRLAVIGQGQERTERGLWCVPRRREVAWGLGSRVRGTEQAEHVGHPQTLTRTTDRHRTRPGATHGGVATPSGRLSPLHWDQGGLGLWSPEESHGPRGGDAKAPRVPQPEPVDPQLEWGQRGGPQIDRPRHQIGVEQVAARLAPCPDQDAGTAGINAQLREEGGLPADQGRSVDHDPRHPFTAHVHDRKA